MMGYAIERKMHWRPTMGSDEERGERWDGWTLPDRQLYAAVGKMMRERDEARAELEALSRAAEYKIGEVAKERNEAEEDAALSEEYMCQSVGKHLKEIKELKALLVEATEELDMQHETVQGEFGRCDDMYMGKPKPPCEVCALIKRLREKGGHDGE
jgi:hypothetical protein